MMSKQHEKCKKIDLYNDPRALQAQDTIDKWDTDKLAAVVGSKLKGKLPPTDIICKYFLDAIENSQYGWFWECPSGVECHYRHCLPAGFVLKTKAEKERAKNAEQDEDEEETLEEKIDAQRKNLDLSKCTPLTLELFKKWKADKEVRRLAEVQVKRDAAEKKAAGSGIGVMSGRDLFTFDPSLFVDDEEADDLEYEPDAEYDPAAERSDDDDVHAKNYDSQAESEDDEEEEQKGDAIDEGEEEEDEEEEKESAASSSSSSAVPASKKSDAAVDGAAAAIDESLFLDEDLPDE